MTTNYIQGDIQDVIKTLEDNSIDFIYTDPPFSITNASWDKPLQWDKLFPEMWRVLKPDGIICLYASIPFTYELLKYETPKYHYSWKKNNKTGSEGGLVTGSPQPRVTASALSKLQDSFRSLHWGTFIFNKSW